MITALFARPEIAADFARFCDIALQNRVHHLAAGDDCFDLAAALPAEIETMNDRLIQDDLVWLLYACSLDAGDPRWPEVLRQVSRLGIPHLLLTEPGAWSAAQIASLAQAAQDWGIALTCENQAPGRLFSAPDQIDSQLAAVRAAQPSASLGILFNPARFLAQELAPLHDVYMKKRFKNDVIALRVVDARPDANLPADESEAPAGRAVALTALEQGNAQIKELVSILEARRSGVFYMIDPADCAPGVNVATQIAAFRSLATAL